MLFLIANQTSRLSMLTGGLGRIPLPYLHLQVKLELGHVINLQSKLESRLYLLISHYLLSPELQIVSPFVLIFSSTFSRRSKCFI